MFMYCRSALHCVPIVSFLSLAFTQLRTPNSPVPFSITQTMWTFCWMAQKTHPGLKRKSYLMFRSLPIAPSHHQNQCCMVPNISEIIQSFPRHSIIRNWLDCGLIQPSTTNSCTTSATDRIFANICYVQLSRTKSPWIRSFLKLAWPKWQCA